MEGLEGQTLETLLQRERERLHKKREEILEERSKLDEVMDSIDGELAAIGAYEAAKNSKTSKNRRSGTRVSRGEKRMKILEVIANASDGLSRREILDAMSVKGDKAGEGSVSNALSSMAKANVIRAPASRGGKYVAA